MATKHFLPLGHTRIACVTGPLHLEDSVNRLMGYKRALEKAGIKYDLQIIYEGKYSIESGCDAVDYLHDKDFSAMFAFNDMAAYGVCNRLKKYNLTVPKHISVVGYDDIFFPKF